MLRYIARRVGTSAIVLLVVTIIVFVLARVIPSDPAIIFVGPKAPPAEIARVHAELGFDRPLIVQYLSYLGGLLHGDWGSSLATKRPVLQAHHSRSQPGFPGTSGLIQTCNTVLNACAEQATLPDNEYWYRPP